MQTAPLRFFKTVAIAGNNQAAPRPTPTRRAAPRADLLRVAPPEVDWVDLLRWRRRARHALVASVACFAFVCIAGRLTAQYLVNASELTIERFALTRPDGDTAEASVDATLSMPRLSFGAALRGTTLILKFNEDPVGTLTAGNWIPLGHGGEVKLTLAGLISVTHFDAFKQLAAEMLLQPNLTLGLRGGLMLGVPPIPLPVGAALEREVGLRGASGLGLRITYFSFRDGQPDEFPGLPSPLPLMLDIEVEVHNPSSFDFSPLGQLELGIASETGLRFAMVRSDGNVDLPPGSSLLQLHGELRVADDDVHDFGPLLGRYIMGEDIRLQNVFLSSTEPLYHKALGGIPLHATLPGLPGGKHTRIFNRVMLMINPAANAWELAQHGDLHDWCWIDGTNPLNVSLSFYEISVNIFFENQFVGDVIVPWLERPINMSAYEQNFVPDMKFPVRLRAPAGTLLVMLERLLIPNGVVHVDLQINLTFAAGNQIYTMPHFDRGVEIKLQL